MFTFVMLAASALLVVLGLFWSRFTRRQVSSHQELISRGVPAMATVVGMNSHLPGTTTSSDAMEAYFPVVRFDSPQGPVEAEVLIGARPAPARKGQQVAVRYDPRQPHRVLLDRGGMASPGGLSCFGTALSVLFIGMAVLLLLFWFVLKVLLNVPG